MLIICPSKAQQNIYSKSGILFLLNAKICQKNKRNVQLFNEELYWSVGASQWWQGTNANKTVRQTKTKCQTIFKKRTNRI